MLVEKVIASVVAKLPIGLRFSSYIMRLNTLDDGGKCSIIKI